MNMILEQLLQELAKKSDCINWTQVAPTDNLQIQLAGEPIDYFCDIIPDKILEHITTETNKYAVQVNPNKLLNMTKEELEEFIGI